MTTLVVTIHPVTDELRIDELGEVSRLVINNMYGQRIASVWTGTAGTAYMDVNNFAQGTYIISGYTAKGELVAMSRFVKL